jgi:AraC-like DNA-binding protein
VKATTDLSINAFIRSIRLRRAAQLIQNTQYNISEICYQVGFNDLKYFRQCFRKQFGKNPSEFTDPSPLTASNESN